MPEPGRAGPSYDLVAERYAAEIAGELTHKPLDRGLLDAVAELAGGGPVADVGCGPGHVAAYLAGRGARTVGLDLSPGMCAVARGAGVVFLQACQRAHRYHTAEAATARFVAPGCRPHPGCRCNL